MLKTVSIKVQGISPLLSDRCWNLDGTSPIGTKQSKPLHKMKSTDAQILQFLEETRGDDKTN